MASGSSSRGSLSINLSDLQTPDTSVFANRCLVADHEVYFEFQFLFERSRDDIQPVVSVITHAHALVAHLWASAQQFYETEKAYHERLNLAAISVGTKVVQAPDAPVVTASIFRIARSGVESSMECYYLPPFVVFGLGRRVGRLQIDPVIRLQMPSPVLLGLLDYIAGNAERIRERFKSLFKPDEQA